jgi:hypothetical protein
VTDVSEIALNVGITEVDEMACFAAKTQVMV